MKDGGSYESQVLVLAQAVGVFVLLEQVSQAVQVSLMKSVNFLAAGTVSVDDRDRPPHWKQKEEGVELKEQWPDESWSICASDSHCFIRWPLD